MTEGAMTDFADWVGRTTERTQVLDPGQANRMNATLDREPAFAEGDPLPPAWHWLYFPDVVRSSELGPEGHPRLGITMPPVPLPRRMWAGGTLTFLAPLPLGVTATQTSTIAGVTPKTGRSGELYFVTVRHEVAADGTVAVREEQTIVYRPMDSAAKAAAPPAPDVRTANAQATWQLDATALFRYSALTFNGHRIHYDADYCRDVEGYSGLVVHGPLLATLLLDLAVQNGREVGTFRYQARSPLVLPEPVQTRARFEGDGTELWACSPGGGLAMSATARPA